MMMMIMENKKTTSCFGSDSSDKVTTPSPKTTTTTTETTTSNKSSSTDNGGDGLCLKLQRTESFPYKSSSSNNSSSRMMMMNQHHSNQGIFGGPTFVNGINESTSGIYDAFNGGGSVLGGAGGGGGGGVVSTRTLLQPFYSAFKSPAGGGVGGGMAATSLRFPFTTAQWQELEQQALIYKYMMASVPIPPDLLIPIGRNLSETTTAVAAATTLIGVGVGGGGHRSSSCFNLRFSNNTDPEPGRCRRTDGKKWRCSRDVAPDQKYCERHMHRGRPRSRKHVEVVVQQTEINNNNNNSNINKMMMFNNHLSSVPPPPSSTTTSNKSSYSGFSSSKPDFKVPPFESVASPRTFKDQNRSMEWMMKGGETAPASATDQVQWGNRFMNSKPEMRNPPPPVFQHQYHQTLNLNSYTDFGTTENSEAQNQSDQCSLYLNPEFSSLDESLGSDHHRETPRRFIDAWSNARDSTSNTPRESNKSSSSSFGNQKLSPSSLTLSMSGCNSTGEEIDEIQMGLGVTDSGSDHNNASIKSQPLSWMTPASWMTSLPGGPLGEVLQSSTAAIHGCSSINSRSSCGGALNLMSEGWGAGGSNNGHETSSSPRLTSISSPSGVLQKTFASLSDSSGNSSPNSFTAAAKSEIALQLLNQSRLPSSS